MQLTELAEIEKAELSLIDSASDLRRDVLAPDETPENRDRRHSHQFPFDLPVSHKASRPEQGVRALMGSSFTRGHFARAV